MNDSRKFLADAQTKLRDAEAKLKAAHQAQNAAADYVDAAETAARRFQDFEQGVTLARAGAIKTALRTGKAPAINPVETLAANAAAKAEAESQRAAAQAALEGLVDEEKSAEQEVVSARAAVKRAIKACVLDEAQAIADKLETLDRERMTLMTRIGGTSGFIAITMRPVSQELAKALQKVEESDMGVGVRNTPAWIAAQTAKGCWEKFIAELEGNPNATLRFNAAAIAAE